jgi:copper chaperone CopZ
MARTKKMNEVRLPISGLAIPGCARRVEDALRTVVGVSGVEVDPMNGQANIIFDPARVQLRLLEAAIHGVGCGTARPDRAVLRMRSTEDAQPRATPQPCNDENPVSIAAISGVTAEDGILQRLITAAVERVGEPAIPVDGSCPSRGASKGTIDRLA